jgi:hypothetical protein
MLVRQPYNSRITVAVDEIRKGLKLAPLGSVLLAPKTLRIRAQAGSLEFDEAAEQTTNGNTDIRPALRLHRMRLCTADHPMRVPVERDHGFRWKMITQSGGT